jgi:alkanesulfonate monooxygenase SsuD/methylene tetrahydromethanopterin reductase-like flavin-dependent oxidoreductase (luciferase family)
MLKQRLSLLVAPGYSPTPRKGNGFAFRSIPVQSDKSFEAMLRQARLVEALGYDVLWAHEHHSGAAMYRSLLTTLAVLAARTERIGLGTNMLLLPLHHPLRVAEEGAMVDVLSGDRLRLGVSAGYAPADLRALRCLE